MAMREGERTEELRREDGEKKIEDGRARAEERETSERKRRRRRRPRACG